MSHLHYDLVKILKKIYLDFPLIHELFSCVLLYFKHLVHFWISFPYFLKFLPYSKNIL